MFKNAALFQSAVWNTCLIFKCICMCVVDIDLQGTDGSGVFGGPDVRRRIPIKLLSKQIIRNKPPAWPQQSIARLPSNGQGDEGERYSCMGHE